jgi:hypothetical protein
VSADEPLSGSSGSTAETSLESDDGTSIKWDNVASVFLGGIFGTIGLGIADLIGMLLSIPVTILETITSAYAGPGADAIFALPATLFDEAVQPSIEAVSNLGVLGFPAALGIVIVTAWLAAKIREVAL